MTRAGPRDGLLLVLAAINIFNGEGFGPILPILVLEKDRDGRADRTRMTDAGDYFRPVGFDFHAAAAPVTLLAPPQFMIDGLKRYGHSSWQPREDGYQTLSVRFTRCLKSKHVG